jgi:hypothetical protein
MSQPMKSINVRGLRDRPSRGTANTTPLIATLGAVLLVGGCASTPAPTAALQSAQQAIDDADRAQASQHAAQDLSEARTKLASAKSAADKRDMDEAARLAEEARVDAELASARTAAAKAKDANDEIRKGMQVLKDELQRNNGSTTPSATPGSSTTGTTGGTTP